MAIPIKRYIDIGTEIIDANSGERDYSALVFTNNSMTEPSDEDSVLHGLYEDYTTNGKVVTLTSSDVTELFASTTDVYKFAAKYFGYVSINGRSPSVINLVKTGSETALAKFNSVISEFNNFGAFTFLNNTTIEAAESGGLLDVAMANQSFGMHYAMVIPVTSTSGLDPLQGIRGLHLVLDDSSATQYTSWMPLAFVASLNYTMNDGASTMMYKSFAGVTSPIVLTESEANAYDAAHVNYIAAVQTRGNNMRFYQRGVNTDNVDLGAYIDASWIASQIESGWLKLVSGSNRIPATAQGASAVSAMITSVAERAITNGCILTNKYLTDSQILKIQRIAGSGAVDAVTSVGYYIDAQIVFEDDKYVCKYILVYAKGDTIEKVDGQHYLV